MNASDVITLGQDALLMGALIAGPLLLGILVVGVLIGIVQAATSVQEMTLSFILNGFLGREIFAVRYFRLKIDQPLQRFLLLALPFQFLTRISRSLS